MAWVAVGATAIGAAGSYLSSRNAPKVPKPTKIDYANEANKLLGVYTSTTPAVQQFEAGARPEYAKLNLGEQANYLQGIGGQLGYIGQAGLAQQQAQEQIQGLRAGEYGSMTGQAGAVRGLLGEMSPEAQRMMQLQSLQAEDAYARSQGLTPQEQRLAQQSARESYSAAGRLGGNAGVASEILNRESTLANKRNEASNATNRAYQTAQNYYSPMSNLLSMTPVGAELGGKYAAQGASMIGLSTPKLFDYTTAFNIGQQGAASQDQYNQAKYAQGMQNTQNNMQMWSSLGSIGSSLASNPSMFGGAGNAMTGQNAYSNAYNSTAGLFGAPKKAYVVG